MLKWVESVGLGVSLAIGVLTMFFYVLKWVLVTQDKIIQQASEERKCWQSLFERNTKSIDEHVAQSTSAHNSVIEANRFQREEHKEITKQLAEITLTLGRINGYKT